MISVGVQLLVVLDASQNVNDPGQTGIARKDEMVQAVQQLTEQHILLADTDWLAFLAFDQSGANAIPQVIAPWNRSDHNAVINSMVTYDITGAKAKTPLSDLLLAALQYFDDAAPPPNLQRAIVVFSDGVDLLSVAQKDDLFRQAAQRRVRIHTVQIGPVRANGEAQKNLQNIALNTNGRYTNLNEANQLLPDLWQAVAEAQSQRAITYRSSKAQPQQITLQTRTGDRNLVADFAVPAPTLQPPQVVLVAPAFAQLEKQRGDGQALSHDTPVTELEPQSLALQVEFNWPDGHPRTLRRVEYIIADQTISKTSAPFEAVTFPIEKLDNGEYTIRVRAIDELGLLGEATPKPLTIVVNRPAPPDFDATATAAAQLAQATTEALKSAQAAALATQQAKQEVALATQAAQQAATQAALQATAQATATALQGTIAQATRQNRQLTWASIVALGLSVLMGGLALYLWFNPRTRRRATEIVTGALRAATEPFFLGQGKARQPQQAKARLVLLEGGNTLEPSILLYGGGLRLGRDPTLANVVLNDQRISRYHCRISEEANGAFRLWDEGSTSGTYVNQEPIGMKGHLLQPGDLVNIGPVLYRFEPLLASAGRSKPSIAANDASAALDNAPTEIGGGGFYDHTAPQLPSAAGGAEAYDSSATQIGADDFDDDDNGSNSDDEVTRPLDYRDRKR
jgi:hypothetical protein